MMRVFTVVTRLESERTPLFTMFAARRQLSKAWPGSSLPIAPKASTRAPRAATLAATLPAPPRHSLCSTKSTTGTAASGERREAVPQRYRSSMRSPSTPMRLPRRRGIMRFNRVTDSVSLSGMRELGFSSICCCLDLRSLFGRYLSFFGQHYGDFVANRVDATARLALEAGVVRRQLHWRLANGTNENIQQLF